MSFIGIIADCKDYEFIEKEILKGKGQSKLKLININEKNIENIKNVKFETMIICTDIDKMKGRNVYIQSILKNTKYLIINSDLNLKKTISNSQLKIITYGLNQKATVTASSIEEDGIMICLQRNIENIENDIIEVQESYIESENVTNKKVYSLMVIFILKQLYN